MNPWFDSYLGIIILDAQVTREMAKLDAKLVVEDRRDLMLDRSAWLSPFALRARLVATFGVKRQAWDDKSGSVSGDYVLRAISISGFIFASSHSVY